MGLDMYLNRKVYIGGQYSWNKIEGEINLTKDGNKIPFDTTKIDTIDERVGYWRKANQIHNWFVKNVQDGNDDCGTYEVDISELKKLLDICKTIKEKCKLVEGKVTNGQTFKDGKWEDIVEDGKVMTNPEIAEELLPTASGFFFGSTDYDEYYMSDIEYTIKIIEEAIARDEELRKIKVDCYYEYSSSW